MFLYGMMMRQSQNIWQWEKTNGVNRLLRNANNFTFFLKSFVPSLFCTFYFEVVPILFFLDCYRRSFFYPILNNYIRIIKSFKKYILSIFNKHLQRLQKFFNLLFSIRDPRSEKIYLYTLYICGHYQHLPEVRRLGVDSWDEQICVVFLVFFFKALDGVNGFSYFQQVQRVKSYWIWLRYIL